MHKALWGETKEPGETRDHGAIFIDVGFHENVHMAETTEVHIVSQFQKLEIWTQGVGTLLLKAVRKGSILWLSPGIWWFAGNPWHSLPYRHTTLSPFIFTWHSHCMCVSVPKSLLFTWAWVILEEGVLCLTSLHLQLPHFRIRYHSEVLEVRTSYINLKKTNHNHQQRLRKSSGLSFSRTEYLPVSVLLKSHPR